MWDVLKQYEVKKMYTQTHIKLNRQMMILTSIRKLKFATRRHLMAIHDMGGIRNANRILKDLSPYVNSTVIKRACILPHKQGRALFDDTEKIVPTIRLLAHSLMRNKRGCICFVLKIGR